nr:hypothetical protein [Sphingomonas jejuensis]
MKVDRRDRHSGELPWGWWLRVRGGEIEDEDGRTWSTVRDAFWEGELGFPDVHFAPEQHELMTRVLTAIDGRWLLGDERRHDLFGGDMLFWRFYQCWLGSIGMLDTAHRTSFGTAPLEAPLSPEGRSVMLMLQATREPAWERMPMAEVVEAVAAAGRGADGGREAALREFERSVGFRRHVFARERVGRTHLVTLTGIAAEARMPTMRVSWSQAFTDETGRDDLFAWLARRVDRWDDWGRLAHGRGADALTRHLLGLIVQEGGLRA